MIGPKFKQRQIQLVEDALAELPASKGLFGSLFARWGAKVIGDAMRDGSMNLLLIIYAAC